MAVGATALVGVSMTETVPSPLLGTYTNGPCCACAASGASIASAPSQAPPSSAARVALGRAADAATWIAGADTAAPGAERWRAATRAVRDRNRCERMICAPAHQRRQPRRGPIAFQSCRRIFVPPQRYTGRRPAINSGCAVRRDCGRLWLSHHTAKLFIERPAGAVRQPDKQAALAGPPHATGTTKTRMRTRSSGPGRLSRRAELTASRCDGDDRFGTGQRSPPPLLSARLTGGAAGGAPCSHGLC